MNTENDDSWPKGAQGDRSFLLRCWKEDQSGELPGWRFLLVRLDQDRKMKGFAHLDKLLLYLREELQIEEANTFENAINFSNSNSSRREKQGGSP